MEGGDERRGDPEGEEEAGDAPGHLLGRLVGEGDGEDLTRVEAVRREETSDAVGDDAGLPAPRPGQDQERPLGMADRLPLGGIQIAENLFRSHVALP